MALSVEHPATIVNGTKDPVRVLSTCVLPPVCDKPVRRNLDSSAAAFAQSRLSTLFGVVACLEHLVVARSLRFLYNAWLSAWRTGLDWIAFNVSTLAVSVWT